MTQRGRSWLVRVVMMLLGLLLGGTRPAWAQSASTIDFNDLPLFTIVTTQYQARGIPVVFQRNEIADTGIAGGAHVLFHNEPGTEFDAGPMRVDFTARQHLVRLSGSFSGSATQFLQATLSAFDAQGNLVAQDVHTVAGGVMNTTFTVSTPSNVITSFEFFANSGAANEVIDDLHFEGEVPSSAPVIFPKTAPPSVGGQTRDTGNTVTGPDGITRRSSALEILITTGPSNPGGGGGSVSTDPQDQTACTGSYVDNLRWSYVHTAVDFSLTGKLDEDCPCGGCKSKARNALPGELKHLEVKRIHRPLHAFVVPSSFGPGVFSTLDTNLTFINPTDGAAATVLLYDVDTDVGPLVFRAAPGDVYVDDIHTYKDLRVLDAAGNLVVSSSPAAVKAVLTAQTGESWTFEVIAPVAGSANRAGRLIRKDDRNGNGEAVAYAFPAGASDAALGFDRTKLWQMSSFVDAYGATATVSYTNVGGRWAIASIGVPNGATGSAAVINYSYPDGVSLGQINYPDSGVSTFASSIDTASQEVVLTIHDAGAPAAGANKEVRLTQSTVATPGGPVVQPPNLVRRVVNGQGEIVYRNWENPNDANVLYVFDAPQKLTRITLASGYPVEVARAPAAFDPATADPTTAAFDVVESYQVTSDFMMAGRSRPDGFSKTFTRDPATRAVTGVQFPGGASIRATYNRFRSPSTIVDLKGNSHTFMYDSKGNVTQATLASGNSAQAVLKTSYNTRGQPLSETDPRGNVTSYTYDARGLLVLVTQPADFPGGTQPKIAYAYDATGRLISETQQNGQQTRYAYDLRGRLVTVTYPDLTTEHHSFLVNLNAPASVTDRNGVLTAVQYDGAGRSVSITRAAQRPEAVQSTFSYLPGTGLIREENVSGDQVTYTYDQRRRLVATSRQNAFGQLRTNSVTWDVFDRKLSETDDQGRNKFYVYDANDRVRRIVRELVTMPGRFSPSNLPSSRDVAANPTYVVEDEDYDVNGLLVSKVDALATRETRRYDALGRQIEVVRGAGTSSASMQRMVYDAAGNNIKVIHPRSFSAEGNNLDSFRDEMTFTGRNLLATVTQAVGRPEATVARRITYTPTGQPATQADANGNVSVLKYDVNDRLIEEDDAAGFATRYAYDGNGNRKSVTDPLGHTTSYAFDGLNRLTKTTKPAGEIETIDYDEDLTDGVGIDASGVAQGLQLAAGVADGSAVRTTSPAGVVVISVKDALGRVVREQKGVGAGAQRITTNFDGATAITPSRPFALAQTQVTDPLGNQSLFNRDGNDAIIEVLDAEGKLTKAVVNAIGESLSERDPTGLGFDCSYDVLGRKTACTDTAGATTSQAYDVADNVIRKTDGLGKVVTTEYDGRNLPITVIDENNQFSRYRYDGLTNLTSVLDVESKTTSYGYDTRGLRTKVTYSDGRTTTTAYDGARRVSSVIDQLNQTITLVYDADGRLISRRYQDNLNDSFSYDADSRLTLAHSSRYNNDVRRIYDNQNRMTSETVSSDGSNRVTQQVFDAADRVTSVTYPNGSVLSKSYNKRHELTGLSFEGVAVANMVRDDAGRPTITTLGNGLRETRTFRQDELLGSVQLSKPSNGAVLASLTYAFDAAKRKTQEKNTLTPSETENFAYDNLDRLTNFAQGSNSQTWVLSPAGNWQNTVRNGAVENRGHGPAYEVTSVTTNVTANLLTDARGSITKDEAGTAYTWDLDNQLQKTVTAGGATTSYTYDALGRRLSRTSGGVKTVFVNEGDRETARPLVEYENGAFRRSYIYGEYIDQLAMMVVGTARYYFTVNEHFSPQAVTDAWGAVVERYRYDAYGQRTVLNGAGVAIPSSTIGNRVGFTGRVHEDSGLVHYRTRYYRPFLGRFVTRDADFTDGPNLYAAYFVPNSLDPTGQWGLKSLVKGVAKVAQKVVAKVEATVKKTGVSLAVVANFKIEGNGTLSFCVGDLTLEGKMSWEVGAKGQAFGVSTFIGIQGDKSLGKVMFHPFDGFGCRGDCDTCCQPVNSVAVNANSTGFFSALKKLEDSLGFEITVGVKSDGCRSEASVKVSADLLPLIPAVGQVIMAINKTRVISVHAGLQGGGTIKSCRSRQQTMVMEDGLLMLGLFGKVGAAVSTG